jgi:hypothetical protein
VAVALHRKGRKGREVKAKEHSACELLAADELTVHDLTAEQLIDGGALKAPSNQNSSSNPTSPVTETW